MPTNDRYTQTTARDQKMNRRSWTDTGRSFVPKGVHFGERRAVRKKKSLFVSDLCGQKELFGIVDFVVIGPHKKEDGSGVVMNYTRLDLTTKGGKDEKKSRETRPKERF